MNYTLKQLLEKYNIVIPLIQRDYAQGRNDQHKLRTKFLNRIKEILTSPNNDTLKLDFVYGYTEPISSDQTAFIPLDGQQRLTTLWLLHWYMCPKVINDINSRLELHQNCAFLNKFSYETRNSSKRFCEELIGNPMSIETENFSAVIRNSPWFISAWNQDPTVSSMLNMIDTIKDIGFDESMYDSLVDRISFDYIDIKSDEFKLTDELYIKMNSRGKPLTPFENFKAEFSGILNSTHTEYADEVLQYDVAMVNYRKYFSFKIDGDWQDLFWEFAKVKNSIADNGKHMLNFFKYFAQMCYFKDNPGAKIEDYKGDFEIFNSKENILLLFNSLDYLHSIIKTDGGDGLNFELLDNYFNSLFLKNEIDGSFESQVRLFDDNETNLFTRCVTEGESFDVRNRILLFCLLAYATKHDTKGLQNYMRVVRNLLQSVRWLNNTVYTTNVRINFFGEYYKLFRQLHSSPDIYSYINNQPIDNAKTSIKDEYLQHERTKAKLILSNPHICRTIHLLEEFKPFRGDIHILKIESNENISKYPRIIREIWANNDPLIIRALIASGFKGLNTKWCKLGDMYYFGKKGQWNTILTCDRDDFSKAVIGLLDSYIALEQGSSEEKLNYIINQYLSMVTNDDYEYYFLKYPEIFTKRNYFAWKDDFALRLLGSESPNPLIAYHINPYVLVASRLLDDDICEEQYCYSQYSRNLSGLHLKNGVVLYSEIEGWRITLPDNYVLQNDIKEKYNLEESLVLKSTENSDRIEAVVNFCNDIPLIV